MQEFPCRYNVKYCYLWRHGTGIFTVRWISIRIISINLRYYYTIDLIISGKVLTARCLSHFLTDNRISLQYNLFSRLLFRKFIASSHANYFFHIMYLSKYMVEVEFEFIVVASILLIDDILFPSNWLESLLKNTSSDHLLDVRKRQTIISTPSWLLVGSIIIFLYRIKICGPFLIWI